MKGYPFIFYCNLKKYDIIHLGDRMFKEAIRSNVECVKPMATAYKIPSSDELISNMFSIILINKEGWALTTKGVANNIVEADKIHMKYEEVKKDLIANKIPPKKIYKKYGIKENDAIILKNVFLNTLTSWSGLKIYAHEYLDLALIKFDDPEEILCNKFPVFASNNAIQGEYLCRLGYPYAEFQAFRYDHSSKDIILNEIIDNGLQIFPLDGMLTRYLADSTNKPTLFELSNSSFIGHTGGPIINKDGEIVGIQVAAAYKDTELDINAKLKRNTKEIEVKQYNFIPFSVCINVDTIREFMDKNNVKYKTK